MTDKVLCRVHGLVPWEGHVECSRCGRAFHRVVAPNDCACGAVLMPQLNGEGFSARCMCPSCYRDRITIDLTKAKGAP